MMQTPSKSKPFLIAIIILLLANIAVLLFFILEKAPGKRTGHEEKRAAITKFLQKEVGFDQQQLQQFDSLSNSHWKKTSAMFDTLRNRKEEQLKQLSKEGYTDSSISIIASQAAEKQRIMELRVLQHIREIRNLCDSSQLPVFDSLFYKVFIRKKGSDKNKEK